MFDTHAHYDDNSFEEDRDKVIEYVHNQGVQYILNAGVDISSSKASIELSKKFDYVYAAIGIHPHDAAKTQDNYIEVLRELSKNEKVVAIGEIGLDYHYDYSPRDIQKKFLAQQINLARELKLPVILHDRESHEDILKILKDEIIHEVGGVMHCFSGSYEMAKEILKMGLYLGIDGPITFSNNKKTVEVVEKIPLEYILVETDCPYLTPVPHRGKRNDSSYLNHIIEKIAQIKNMEFNEVNNILVENGKRLFKIK